jgi:acylphosphatase
MSPKIANRILDLFRSLCDLLWRRCRDTCHAAGVPSETAAQQVLFEGRVQGVGFRYTVKSLASGFEVVGWVRNLIDGRVEMVAQGEPQEVDAFIEEIRNSALRPYIARHTRRNVDVDQSLTGFRIQS